ncbi:polysaccharide biosynthesis C-terminal domain-containing protein [Tropicimonas sediminicola]|uniref:Membrane protein involved in the export of O-antigen and teichoic acid n=1 Tax=Tropicimonas sediminicola TaxID=1031541 RepID=A0A239LVA6_9RHOB|nr:polysaccharide biosynthesis C-terminal domain-containing protein [Tropicimonas sediminicola]SNT33554.1 Membrane protein involved in the export of O-antigen and teichoic acid [Tropicimonas sediminicola]
MSQPTEIRTGQPRPAPSASLIARITGWERDLVLSVLSQLVQKLPGLVGAVVLARHFDIALMGQFFFCGVIAAIAATVSHLGTDRALNRSVAQNPEGALEMLGKVLPLRLVAIAGLWVGINGIVALVAPDLLAICALTTGYMLLGNLFFSFSAVFVGLRWAGLRLVIGAIGPLLIALSSCAVFLGWSLPAVLALYCCANALMVAVAIRVTRARLGRPDLVWNFDALRPVLLLSAPFLAIEIVLLIQAKIDVLMIYAMSTPAAVAEYETSYRLLEVTRTLIRPLMMVFVPIAAAMAATGDHAGLARVVRRLLAGVSLAGAVLALVSIAFAEPIVVTVWGETYRSGADIFSVLALATVPLFLGLASLHLAGALHRERSGLRILMLTALVNAGTNAMVIPRFGALGAAWTTFATECLAALALMVLILRATRTSEGGTR